MLRQSKQLTVGTAISIAKQVTEGLSEAHRLGIVHRDLKPSNILIDKDGDARIMDFGIARSIAGEGITDKGMIIGTPEYMSPEQVEGKDIDQRTDIYSLGVILYEMVTGKIPFVGDTPISIAHKHKYVEPQEPRDLNSQISDDLNRVILICLEKDKEKRYQSADEIRSELANIEESIPLAEREASKRKTITSKEITVTFGLKKQLIPVLIFIAVVIIGVVVWQLLFQKEEFAVQPMKTSVAVLPFTDLSSQGDQEYFCDGMTDEIIAKLSKLKEWIVMSRTTMMKYRNTDKSIEEIGQDLDVGVILEGSVRKEKDDIRVNVALIDVQDSSQLWSESYSQKLESVFAIQSDIAQKITEALKARLSPGEKEQLMAKPTENLIAYE
jgi:serine/threonine protein kinase